MHYCGLDVSMKSTHAYIENAQGRRVKQTECPTTPEGIERALGRYLGRRLKVAIEAGAQTAWIHDLLREHGVEVHVVHPLKVKWIAESKKKNDRVDAKLLAYLLRIGGLPEPVHMPGPASREVRAVLCARRQLVRARTQLINVIRGLLRQQRVTLKARALNSRRSWLQVRALPLTPALQEVVAAYDTTMTALTTALRALEQELAQRAAEDARVPRLQSVPGFGAVVAQTLTATIDRVERFGRAKQVVSYAGLAPSVRGSGGHVKVRADHEGRTRGIAGRPGSGRARGVAGHRSGRRPVATLACARCAPAREKDRYRRPSAQAAHNRLPSAPRRNHVSAAASPLRRIERPQDATEPTTEQQ